MNPIDQAYIKGIDFAITQVETALKNILTYSNSPSLVGSKLSFLEPVREIKKAFESVSIPSPCCSPVPIDTTELDIIKAENTKLKEKNDVYSALCADILQNTKAKRVREQIIAALMRNEGKIIDQSEPSNDELVEKN